ncbi:MAG TPA: DUF1772 domain-containing protein [Roseiarcus sp.]|nr:DUF1772 domain-containing protein [Roseiarcus sp.]
MNAGTLALAFASALAGAGLYVNGVEQPARLALDDEAMLKEWGPSDRRGVLLMATLALLAGVCGLSAWFETGDPRFAIGAVIAVASWPYTLYAMGPINNQIIALIPKDVGAARTLVWQWGLLEYGQTVIALAAAATFLWAL